MWGCDIVAFAKRITIEVKNEVKREVTIDVK